MKIEKLLFPTRFRELAFDSLQSLLVLKDAGLKEIVFCYIIPREDVGFVPYGGYLKEEEERVREEARIRFEDWQKVLSEKGIGSKIVIEVGSIVPGILSIAERERVDMLVVGRKKKVGLEMSFAGSHTLQLIMRSKIPTLVSKYMVEFQWNGETATRVNADIFRRPLLATDWSEPSIRTLEFLTNLKTLIEKVFICHIIGVKISKGLDKMELLRIEKESKERLKDYCKRLKSAGIPAEPHLGAGKILLEILRLSRDLHASMIIMGTTGKDRLHEIWLGSISHRVAEGSELPTLLVP